MKFNIGTSGEDEGRFDCLVLFCNGIDTTVSTDQNDQRRSAIISKADGHTCGYKEENTNGGGPQHIPTPLPTAFPTRFPTVNPHPDDVPNYNNKIYNGFQELIVVPIEFDNVKWNTSGVRAIPYQEIRAALQRTQDFFEEKSIGRMTFTGKDGHSYIEIMEPQLVTDTPSNCNARSKVKNQIKIPGYHTRIAIYPETICSFANYGSGFVHLSSNEKSTDTRTMIHELGHALGLGHANRYVMPNGIFSSYDEYGDFTSYMGDRTAGDFNAPMHHRLGWVRSHEVRYIRLDEPNNPQSYVTHRIRAFDRTESTDDVNIRAALVYTLPHTQNRLFFSLVRQQGGVFRTNYFESEEYGIVIHIAGECRECSFMRTAIHRVFKNDWIDETGLLVNVTYLNNAGGVADISFRYDPKHDNCTKVPQIKFSSEIISNTNRNKEALVTLEVNETNPNYCRPIFLPNDYDLLRGNSNTNIDYLQNQNPGSVFSEGCTYGIDKFALAPNKCHVGQYMVSTSTNIATIRFQLTNEEVTRYCIDFRKNNPRLVLCSSL